MSDKSASARTVTRYELQGPGFLVAEGPASEPTKFSGTKVYLASEVDPLLTALAEQDEAIARLTQEIVICAAIVAEDGRIFRGHRHVDALRTAGNAGTKQQPGHEHQGFVTSRNRYVNREEAARLQIAAGIASACPEMPYLNGECYSEDLY